jgi:hypothetical protein
MDLLHRTPYTTGTTNGNNVTKQVEVLATWYVLKTKFVSETENLNVFSKLKAL